MNIQSFFVKSDDRSALLELVAARLSAPADAPDQQPDWGLESSYDVWLAGDPKRKVAVSLVQDHWVAAVESKEVLDFAMLQSISEHLSAEVVACQLAGAVDSWGYARRIGGRPVESGWRENDPDPLNSLRAYLRGCFIAHDIISFREAIRLRGQGWTLVQNKAPR